jgi:hypothetical protein
MTPQELETKIETQYHEALKYINKVYNHPLMAGTPGLRNELKNATDSLINLRDLTRKKLL